MTEVASERSSERTHRRGRRSQEQRSAKTRALVLEAATECVGELGMRGATMTAIAQRAGVSWGAMQHQFGEKDAIFDAVLDRAIDDLDVRIGDLADEIVAPSDRVRAFVAKLRDLSRGPAYRVFIEIQMERARRRGTDADAWSRRVDRALGALWLRVFGDLPLSAEQLEDARRFSFAMLSGVACEGLLFPELDFTERHFEILEESLMRLLRLEEE